MEVWAPLLNGGCIVVIEQREMLEPTDFARVIAEQGVTVLFMTTAVFNQYAALIPGTFSGLRYLLTGGEKSEPASFARVLQKGAPRHLIHCYGPTETTTFAITHDIREVEKAVASIPLGRPIANTRVYILDPERRPVPMGVAGELYIAGAGVALGYLNRPELTAERFLDDPFAPADEPGARMYKTGDQGRWLADGTIEFLGRSDFQVKIRGFRIELGEIEARIATVSAVKEAVVLAREDAPGEKRLAAYYTCSDGLDAEALREQLAIELPEYMVPAAYVRLEQMPLTPNGKIDRKALPAPEADAYSTRAYEAPQGEVEETLAEIWAGLLKLERIGRHDHFFELGGHSLMAVTLIQRMREKGLYADVRVIFTSPTLATLAAVTHQDGSAFEVHIPANPLRGMARAEQTPDNSGQIGGEL
jgi:acyl-coenzyme A synthetase/AMP-(fatty) acid ligase